MNVKSMFARSKARKFRIDLHPVGNFSEGNSATDLVVLGGTKDCNGF
jgi:hypothetical protein